MTQPSGRLIVIGGLPGSGKTTRALELAASTGGTRLSPDDRMERLGIDMWDSDARARIEALQFDLAVDLIRLGGVAIIEWGTWAREERDRLRRAARDQAARVELVWCSAPPDELYARISARDREQPPISRAQIDEWARIIETPTAEEHSLFDPPLEAPRD
ncbi:AAA family ATPase [Devosia sp.]|uniref:AAA family ATPase n=1 Tax=Devosia sp. TaxID=1871048 RepID=UPI003A9103D9